MIEDKKNTAQFDLTDMPPETVPPFLPRLLSPFPIPPKSKAPSPLTPSTKSLVQIAKVPTSPIQESSSARKDIAILIIYAFFFSKGGRGALFLRYPEKS